MLSLFSLVLYIWVAIVNVLFHTATVNVRSKREATEAKTHPFSASLCCPTDLGTDCYYYFLLPLRASIRRQKLKPISIPVSQPKVQCMCNGTEKEEKGCFYCSQCVSVFNLFCFFTVLLHSIVQTVGFKAKQIIFVIIIPIKWPASEQIVPVKQEAQKKSQTLKLTSTLFLSSSTWIQCSFGCSLWHLFVVQNSQLWKKKSSSCALGRHFLFFCPVMAVPSS